MLQDLNRSPPSGPAGHGARSVTRRAGPFRSRGFVMARELTIYETQISVPQNAMALMRVIAGQIRCAVMRNHCRHAEAGRWESSSASNVADCAIRPAYQDGYADLGGGKRLDTTRGDAAVHAPAGSQAWSGSRPGCLGDPEERAVFPGSAAASAARQRRRDLRQAALHSASRRRRLCQPCWCPTQSICWIWSAAVNRPPR